MICPKCKQNILIHNKAGSYSFKHKGKVHKSKWDAGYYCPWCNKAFTEDLKYEIRRKK